MSSTFHLDERSSSPPSSFSQQATPLPPAEQSLASPSSSVSSSPSSHPLSQAVSLYDEMIQFIGSMLHQMLELLNSKDSSTSKDQEELGEKFKALSAQLKTQTTEKYNTDEATHRYLLAHLWEVSFPGEELEAEPPLLKSDQWKRLGFQNALPSSDFRGAGLFGLLNLLYFAKRYPKTYQSMLMSRQDGREQYPFAIAGLNVTMLIFGLLGWGMPNQRASSVSIQKALMKLIFESEHQQCWTVNEDQVVIPKTRQRGGQREPFSAAKQEDNPPLVDLIDFGDLHGVDHNNPSPHPSPVDPLPSSSTSSFSSSPSFPSPDVSSFEEIFCLTFKWLDDAWFSSGATYMQFNSVLASTKKKLEEFLPGSSMYMVINTNEAVEDEMR